MLFQCNNDQQTSINQLLCLPICHLQKSFNFVCAIDYTQCRMSKKTNILLSFFLFLIFGGCSETKLISIDPNTHLSAKIIHEENFGKDLDQWVNEQMPGGSVKIVHGVLDIEDKNGCTLWFRKKLKAPLMVEYEATVIDRGGTCDGVSDLNCFWMANDPLSPDDFFARTNERSGKFQDYDHLSLYYVGLGAHDNTRTRFRRYDGQGNRPLLEAHDLTDRKYLITPNNLNHIRIIVLENRILFYRNDTLFYDVHDQNPYHEGHFGLRTWVNHMQIDNFKAYKLTNKR